MSTCITQLYRTAILTATVAVPQFFAGASVVAQSSSKFSDFPSLVRYLIEDIGTVVANVLASVVILYFLYGAGNYVLHAEDEEKRAEGRKMMLYGIIAIAVMVSLWALVRIITTTILQ